MTSPAHRHRRAFGYCDLIVLLLILVFTGVFALGVVDRAHEVDSRIACAKNLRTIGQGLILYASENKGVYPRTRFDPAAGKWNAYTGWPSADPFDAKKGGPLPDVNDLTAPLFLLIRTQEMTPDTFVCPSSRARRWDFSPALEKDDAARRAVTAQHRSNFPSPAFLSYSYANAYPDRKATAAGYRLSSATAGEFAVAADMNPGGDDLAKLAIDSPPDQMKAANSLNHDRAGQNVLYGDGHVEFRANPFAGVKRDNVYTVAGGDDGAKPTPATIVGSPRGPGDSVLLPTADTKGDEKAEKLSPPSPEDLKPRQPPDGRIAIAEANLAALRAAIEVFEIDNGRFPSSAEGLAALIQQPPNTPNWHGPYIEVTNAAALKDPWGNAFVYAYPGAVNKGGFDLTSAGPDGKPGSADDIGNPKEPK